MASPAGFSKLVLFVGLLLILSPAVSAAQTLTVLHSFDGSDGAFPADETLAQGQNGDLYGTTQGGTPMLPCGTAFRITTQGAVSVYTFDGKHGCSPLAGLVLDADGLLRGTTAFGGASNEGVVFSVGLQAPIVVFLSFNFVDGDQPLTPLTLGVDGTSYGTTVSGGATGFGTVFGLSPSEVVTVLHSFSSANGSSPLPSGLAYGPDHAFYGTTSLGGEWNVGTIFRVTRSGTFQTIYNFDGKHGGNPKATILFANDGAVYGTTAFGGDFDQGVVFRSDPTGPVTVLHSFDGADGQFPSAGLIQATDGNLYGTTHTGGTFGSGTLFRITTDGTLTVLYNFYLSHGMNPSGLMQHTNGKLYGTTISGGDSKGCAVGCGTVYSFDVGLGPFVTFVRPFARVGSGVQILGQGLAGTTAVTFNGVPATTFNVASDTFMEAIVPPGATTGPVQVTAPSGPLTSNVNLQIVP